MKQQSRRKFGRHRSRHDNRLRSQLAKILSPARAFLYEFTIFTGAISGWHPMGLGEYEDKLHLQEVRERRERLRELQRRKLIETKRIGEKLMVRLTAKGWQQVLRDRIRCANGVCKDGICIVIFDVPEKERRVRDTLRWILSECRFEMLQKSVWINKKDVVEPLCALLQGAKLDRWVRIIVGKELGQAFLRNAALRLGAHKEANQRRSNN